MSNGNPFKKLSMRPPSAAAPVKTMTEEEGAKNLEALDEWTEQPAKEIANAIGQVAEKAVEKTPEAEAPVEQVAEQPKKTVVKKGQATMPWENVSGIKSMTFRLPAELAEKLKYLGGTIYGETINSVATTALEKEVKRLLKERHEQQQLNGI